VQQQLAKVGIRLELRTYEFATFYSDVTRGAFQMYSLRWIGGNEQPDIFSYRIFDGDLLAQGANRSHYSNPRPGRAAGGWDGQRKQTSVAGLCGGASRFWARRSSGHQPLVPRHGGVGINRRLTACGFRRLGDFTFLETAELAE